MKYGSVKIYHDTNGLYRYQVADSTGRPLADSRTYTSVENLHNGLNTLIGVIDNGKIIDLTKKLKDKA